MLTESDRERFAAKIAVAAPCDCWPWTGARTSTGYGSFWLNRRAVVASRLVLETKLGRPLSNGAVACHTCDNPQCCNPSHLWEGSQSDNVRDARSKGRLAGQLLTHCRHGHPLSGSNLTYSTQSSGLPQRRCRECQRATDRRKYRRERDAARTGEAA